MCIDGSKVTIPDTSKMCQNPFCSVENPAINFIHTTFPCQTFMEDVKITLVS